MNPLAQAKAALQAALEKKKAKMAEDAIEAKMMEEKMEKMLAEMEKERSGCELFYRANARPISNSPSPYLPVARRPRPPLHSSDASSDTGSDASSDASSENGSTGGSTGGSTVSKKRAAKAAKAAKVEAAIKEAAAAAKAKEEEEMAIQDSLNSQEEWRAKHAEQLAEEERVTRESIESARCVCLLLPLDAAA